DAGLAEDGGGAVAVALAVPVVADAADGPRFLLTHVEDIEERKRHELQLAHRASHDALTGLPNSAELRSRLSARLCERPVPSGTAAGPGPDAGFGYGPDPLPLAQDGYEYDHEHEHGFGFEPAGGGAYDHHVHTVAPAGGDTDDGTKGLAVLFCDLDGFKSINDRFGHHTGDAVLIEVARRLTTGVRDGDTVARLGGDEFVVLADGLGAADAADLAVRLRNAIIPPIRVDGRAVRVGASFGIGWAECGMTVEEVLNSADQRMYVEKRSRAKVHRRAG
ncbi:GGDEF domain-containing protein, partial [Streptomyces sp. NPDC057866]|uniref:GGDEF domain-containing protein n=1 Tax=Streptomyces sp. NPDC057866 TaxID=3346268 RepID=UPI0036BED9D4